MLWHKLVLIQYGLGLIIDGCPEAFSFELNMLTCVPHVVRSQRFLLYLFLLCLDLLLVDGV